MEIEKYKELTNGKYGHKCTITTEHSELNIIDGAKYPGTFMGSQYINGITSMKLLKEGEKQAKAYKVQLISSIIWDD